MPDQIPVTDYRPDSHVADFASLLSRIYKLTDFVVTQLEVEDDPATIRTLVAKTNILKGLAKMLPTLQQAENNANILDEDNSNIADWSREKLEAVAARIKPGG